MHPTIIQDHPGDCPLCGMKLIKMDGVSNAQETSTGKGEKKILFYRSPMDPRQTSPAPRKDEMGMDYIPVYESETTGGGSTVANRAEVTIDPSRQQLIGLRTAPVTHSELSAKWRTVGRVQTDPTKVRRVNVKVTGYVERIHVNFIGQPVKRGEPLFTLYSPELLTAQREYLLALNKRESYSENGAAVRDSMMIVAARQKLKLWDVSESQINRLEETGEIVKALTIVSPVTGIVTAKNIVEGSTLNMGDTPYEVTDLSMVWVLADAYQTDAARAKVGLEAEISLASLPNHTYSGIVDFIDPVLDPVSRTYKIRININNTNLELKPEMFAEVLFQGSAHEALIIPADAIIPSGRGNMVFVAVGDGKFQPRSVILGEKSGDQVEVLEGVREGELVVTRANFLIDSESSLRAALSAAGGAE
jgi:Cu(I)/Ag(I) efflux system membrane fusion protein